LLHSPRTASVRARSSSKVRCIPSDRQPFEHHIITNPALGYRIAVTLGCRVFHSHTAVERVHRNLTMMGSFLRKISLSFLQTINQIESKLSLSGDKEIHQLRKRLNKSIHTRRAPVPTAFEPLIPVLSRSAHEVSNASKLFEKANILEKVEGEVLPLQGQLIDFLYILESGKVSILRKGETVGICDRVGDMLGGVKALSSLGMNVRNLHSDPFELVVSEPARLICVSNADLRQETQNNPQLTLYMDYILAETLRKTQNDLSASLVLESRLLSLLSKDIGSWRSEIEEIFEIFFNRKSWFMTCMGEVLKLKQAVNSIELNYIRFSNSAKTSYDSPIFTQAI
jgi:hypothetical protein